MKNERRILLTISTRTFDRDRPGTRYRITTVSALEGEARDAVAATIHELDLRRRSSEGRILGGTFHLGFPEPGDERAGIVRTADVIVAAGEEPRLPFLRALEDAFREAGA